MNGSFVDSANGPFEPAKKYEELLKLKNSINLADQSKDSAENFAQLQRLRNEAQELRYRLNSSSASPSQKEATDLITFANTHLHKMTADSRSSGSSTPGRGSYTPMANRLRGGMMDMEADRLSEQTRMIADLKDTVERRMDRFENMFNTRWDRFENVLTTHGSRLDRLEASLSSLQLAQTRIEDTNSRNFSRMEDQYQSLNRKIDSIEDRQNRRIDDLMKERVSAIPPVLHLNLTGAIPQLGIQPQSGQNIEQPSSDVSTASRSQASEGRSSANMMASAVNVPQDLSTKSAAPSAPFTVNVPKPKPSPVDQLADAKVCGPSTSQNKPSTVEWNASQTKPDVVQTSNVQQAAPKPDVTKPPPTIASFGGFNLTTKTAPAASTTSQDQPAKPSLFSGFQGFATPTKDQAEKPAVAAFPFTPVNSQTVDFRTLAQQAATQPPAFSQSQNNFPGSGQRLFSAVKPVPEKKQEEEEEGEEEGTTENYEPNVDFKPLVSLPEVAVKTGEEDYEVVFKDRAKLYRFDRETKEWKERGLGDMTLQKRIDPATGRLIARVLMRWEKTLKICANHAISPQMKLERQSEAVRNCWRWMASDFADGEVKTEMFTIKFKTPEQADVFAKHFNELKDAVEKQSSQQETPKPEAKPQGKEPQKTLSELFKPKAGAWSCSGCYVNNEADKTTCAACGTAKPGSEPNTVAASTGAMAEPAFSFGYQTATAASEAAKPAFASPFTGFATGSSGFSFGTTTPAKQEAAPVKAEPETKSSPFAGGFKFNLGAAPSTAAASPKRDEEEEGEEDVEAERHDLVFEPVVQLPENVDLKTGEENETELYCQRAKLYRFDQGEWKERGVGDLRMLKDQATNKIRLLMRREKIHKVCCNHLIKPEMELKPYTNTKNAWIWDAMDFSEGAYEHQMLAVRFKHEAHAKEFKELFERCQRILEGKEPSVDKFPRVQVNDGETLAPIAESGKKAVEMMSVNNPFQHAASPKPLSGDQELQARQSIVGDEVYKRFGIIYGKRGEVVALFEPSMGFLRLSNASDLDALIRANEKSEEEFLRVLRQSTLPISLEDAKNVPEAVRRYSYLMRVKDAFESEIHQLPVFDEEVTFSRRVKNSQWNTFPVGRLRIFPNHMDAPCTVQYLIRGQTTPVSSHCLAADANVAVDPATKSVQWEGMEECLDEEDVVCEYRVDFGDQVELDKFEELMEEAVKIAGQQDFWNKESQ